MVPTIESPTEPSEARRGATRREAARNFLSAKNFKEIKKLSAR